MQESLPDILEHLREQSDFTIHELAENESYLEPYRLTNRTIHIPALSEFKHALIFALQKNYSSLLANLES